MGQTTATCEKSRESTAIQEFAQKLAKEIESRLNLLDNSQHVALDYCIFRIPAEFSEENMAPYRPHYVQHRTLLKDSITLIKVSLAKIQGCYEEPYPRFVDDFTEKQLIEMILVDAGFILQLLLRAYSKECRVENDVIFAYSGTMHYIKQDLMLMENQLPFFLLRDMYELAFSGSPDFPSFLHLTCHFFSRYYYDQTISIQDVLSINNPHPEYRSKLDEAKHFTDLVRTLQVPYSFNKHSVNEESQCWKWIIRGKQYFMDLISQKPKEDELEEILDEGKVQELTTRENHFMETSWPAWELCYYPNDTFICDYILLMAYLIKSVEDVDLLLRRRIIINQLGNPKSIVTLFNRLCKHIRMEKNRYSDLFMMLNEYNAVRHHGWIAILKLQYFSTPWKGVATIAATILLVQTICAVLSL
ncbi:hypothetical protein DITRI_Ditri07aG0008600 [Diplodiscus trichospermus]